MSPRTEPASTTDLEACSHPARRVFAWVAYDGTLCAGCCACGQVLAGEALHGQQQDPDDG